MTSHIWSHFAISEVECCSVSHLVSVVEDVRELDHEAREEGTLLVNAVVGELEGEVRTVVIEAIHLLWLIVPLTDLAEGLEAVAGNE